LTRYEAVPKFINCKRAGAVEFDWTAVQNGFRWQATLMADDPLKYGSVLLSGTTGVAGSAVTGHTFPVTFPMSFTGSVSGTSFLGVYNAGTAYSPNFKITVNGLLGKGAWRLSNDTTAEYLGYNVALATTDQLVIDFREQLATLNGQPLSADYVGSFWQLAPGSNTIRLYAEYDPTAAASLVGYSAWE
jgi:hypothetical protein